MSSGLRATVLRLRHAGWGLGDQALSSITNFALLVIVARNVAPSELGAFALFIAGYTTLTYFSESVISEPLVVRYSAVSAEQWSAGVSAASACALGIGCICALALAGIGLTQSGSLRALLLIGAICAPGLLLQDAMRFAFFARRKPQFAFLNDLAWAAGQLSAILLALALSQRSISVLVFTWAAPGALCGFLAMLQASVRPRPSRATTWLSEQRDLWRFIVLERLSGQGAIYISLICISGIAGLTAIAAVRSAQALYGPLNVAINAARIMGVPALVRSQPSEVRRLLRIPVLLLAAVAAAWGVVTLLIPHRLGLSLFGRTWPLAAPLLPFLAIDRTAASASEGYRLGLLSLAKVRRSLFIRLTVGLETIIGAAVGAAWDGARGAVIAGAIVMPLGTILFRAGFLRAARQREARSRPAAAAEPLTQVGGQ